jgi:hypothetical protein
VSTPASSTTKTGRHDIAEKLLKVALKYNQSIKIFDIRILITPLVSSNSSYAVIHFYDSM